MPKKDAAFLDALATALIEELESFASQDLAAAELLGIETLMREDAAARDFLTQSGGTAERMQAVAKLFGDRIQPPVKNTLLMLIREGAMAELPRFLTRYQDMRQRLGKARTVIAESPQPLAAEDRKKLQTILEKKWGMDVSLEEQTVPSLIGGLRLRSGDWQFDASVRGRLERLAHHFTSTI